MLGVFSTLDYRIKVLESDSHAQDHQQEEDDIRISHQVERIYPSDQSDGGVYEQQDGDDPEYIYLMHLTACA